MNQAEMMLFNAETPDDVKKALAVGADINAQDEHGNTFLSLIVAEDVSEKFVKFLIKEGADVNIKDDAGYTSLFYAGTPKIARLLIEAGADKESKKMALESAKSRHDAAMVAAIEGDGRIYVSDMKSHIEEVKTKLKNKTRKGVVSGTVAADRIAEGIQNGTIIGTVTPKKGKELSANIKKKYVLNKKQNF